MHEFTWRSWQAIRSIEIQRLRGVATTARALCDVHVTVLTVVATAVALDTVECGRIQRNYQE
jgi:L-aminopeptidase/D-esterase-like protein